MIRSEQLGSGKHFDFKIPTRKATQRAGLAILATATLGLGSLAKCDPNITVCWAKDAASFPNFASFPPPGNEGDLAMDPNTGDIYRAHIISGHPLVINEGGSYRWEILTK